MARKINIILAITLGLFLTGCATTETKFVTRVETVTVYKPVYTPPKDLQEMEKIQRPDLATNHLREEDKQNPGHVVKVTVEAMAQLRTYAEQLETQLEVFRDALSKPADPIPETERKVETHESDKPFEDK